MDQDSLEELEVVEGPCQAKANALQNQVWLKADGSVAAQKRAACVTITCPFYLLLLTPFDNHLEKCVKVPQTPSSNDDDEKENIEPVSIPVPRAPWKPKKQRILPADGRLKPVQVNYDLNRVSDEGSTMTLGIAGSEANNEAEDEEESDGYLSEASSLEEISADPHWLKKMLLNEQPIWSDNRDFCLKPAFEIKSAPMVVNYSMESFKFKVEQQQLTKQLGKQVLQPRKPLTQLEDIFTPHNFDSDRSHATEPPWPTWTDLTIGLNGNLKLMEQEIEIQLILCQSMALIEEWIIFEDSFPCLPTHNVWN
ncbi:hypothetical protein APHAL10511_008022 [Amanita phalloides]|nr:hypothetical protein APHAL10511_008022 [Amanita phalloides]